MRRAIPIALLLVFTIVAPAQNAAIRALQNAVKNNPDSGEARYNLGLAYHAIGDEAEAEAELREAVRLMPDSVEARNALEGVLSAMRGPVVPVRAENPIRVDVRQVLVPVVVTDKDGLHVTGLTQSDFRILEDGVEQKITSFSVETAGLATAHVAAPSLPATAKRAAPVETRSASVERTYLVCIDTLHASFNNFVSVRRALEKLFQEEHSADSQYVLIALGLSSRIVVNTTPDPNAILAALESKKFQKFFLEGQVGGLSGEMTRFRRDLNDTRVTCDVFAKTGDFPLKVKCDVGKDRGPEQARQIAELDRTLTVGFLRQFRALVAQLARASDRRTIVLVSDGFQINPGREAWDLLTAFFPDLSRYAIRSAERMQSEFEPILQLAAKSNITIDTIDSRGLYGQSSFDASHEGVQASVDAAVGRVERNVATDSGNTLIEIAQATGGTAFRDNNNLLAGLQRAFADGRNYYTIGYLSTNPNVDGKFRAITVQVPKHPVVVNAKHGYWAQ